MDGGPYTGDEIESAWHHADVLRRQHVPDSRRPVQAV